MRPFKARLLSADMLQLEFDWKMKADYSTKTLMLEQMAQFYTLNSLSGLISISEVQRLFAGLGNVDGKMKKTIILGGVVQGLEYS